MPVTSASAVAGVVAGLRAAPRRASVASSRRRLAWPPAPRRPAARSASSSSRLPSPTTSTRPGRSGWSSVELLEAALGVVGAGRRRRARPAAPRPRRARRRAGRRRPRERLALAHVDLHRGASLCACARSPAVPPGIVPSRARRPLPSRDPAQTRRRKAADAQHSHPRNRAHPLRQDGRRPLLARRHRPRRPRDRGGARALRRRPRAGPAGRLRPGPAGRPGPDPLAPGPDQGRHPQGGPLGDDQQGLRLGHALDRHRRPGDPRRRHRGRRDRRHGVDEPGALPAARRPLRLPDGRRQGDRRDDPRRPHQPLHREADDQRGERGLQRARDHPRRHGPLRRALAPARRRGDRRRPPRRRDRRRHGQVAQGREHGRGRRGDPPRHDRRDARRS